MGDFTQLDENVIEGTVHNHVASPRKVIALEVSVAVKMRALDTLEQPHQFLQNVTSDIPVQVASKLPSYKAMQLKMERIRKP